MADAPALLARLQALNARQAHLLAKALDVIEADTGAPSDTSIPAWLQASTPTTTSTPTTSAPDVGYTPSAIATGTVKRRSSRALLPSGIPPMPSSRGDDGGLPPARKPSRARSAGRPRSQAGTVGEDSLDSVLSSSDWLQRAQAVPPSATKAPEGGSEKPSWLADSTAKTEPPTSEPPKPEPQSSAAPDWLTDTSRAPLTTPYPTHINSGSLDLPPPVPATIASAVAGLRDDLAGDAPSRIAIAGMLTLLHDHQAATKAAGTNGAAVEEKSEEKAPQEADVLADSLDVPETKAGSGEAVAEAVAAEEDDDDLAALESGLNATVGSEALAENDSLEQLLEGLGLDGNVDLSMSMADLSMCDIPQAPTGTTLTIRMFSTWGDSHYIGLNGIQLYRYDASLVTAADATVTANPPSINVLPEYDDDPRVVANLLDGVNHTCDDTHSWLAPFSPGKVVTVTITMDRPTTLSLMRIWNFNKSRVTSYRGARLVAVELDGKRIFEGEIRKAPGQMGQAMDSSEVILFTTDEDVLAAVEAHDDVAAAEADVDETDQLVRQVMKEKEAARPRTGGGIRRNTRAPVPDLSYEQVRALEGRDEAAAAADGRPLTSALSSTEARVPPTAPPRSKSTAVLPPSVPRPASAATGKQRGVLKRPYADVGGVVSPDAHPKCRTIHVSMVDTWNDCYYLGVTGLEVLVVGETSTVEAFPLSRDMLDANPLDINQAGFDGDLRTLDKLVNGVNVTTKDVNMWMLPYTPGGDHTLDIDLGEDVHVYGLRIWNYNKSRDDTARGVRHMRVSLDGVTVATPSDTNAITVRRAPGVDVYDFGQDFVFELDGTGTPALVVELPKAVRRPPEKARRAMAAHARKGPGGLPFIHHALKQDYEPPLYPSGMTLKFVLTSTHGDQYYIGLDSLSVYDAACNRIPLHPSQLFTAPTGSINDLHSTKGREAPPGDPRVLGNLAAEYDASTWTPARSWLAPLAHSTSPGTSNVIWIVFNQPVTLSMVKLWNYSRTPARGVSSLDLWLDDYLVHSTEVKPATGGPPQPQTLLFAADPTLVAAERPHLHYCGNTEQDVLCVNENKIMVASKALHVADPTAEGYVADLEARPGTSLVDS